MDELGFGCGVEVGAETEVGVVWAFEADLYLGVMGSYCVLSELLVRLRHSYSVLPKCISDGIAVDNKRLDMRAMVVEEDTGADFLDAKLDFNKAGKLLRPQRETEKVFGRLNGSSSFFSFLVC